MSDRAYFHEIEAHLAFELGSFIAACLPQEETERLEEIRNHDRRPPDSADVLDWELSDLIGFFTRRSFFDKAQEAAGWRGKSMLSRAYLIREARNRYSHTTPSQPLSTEEQIAHFANIREFLNALPVDSAQQASRSQAIVMVNERFHELVASYAATNGLETHGRNHKKSRQEEPSEQPSREPKKYRVKRRNVGRSKREEVLADSLTKLIQNATRESEARTRRMISDLFEQQAHSEPEDAEAGEVVDPVDNAPASEQPGQGRNQSQRPATPSVSSRSGSQSASSDDSARRDRKNLRWFWGTTAKEWFELSHECAVRKLESGEDRRLLYAFGQYRGREERPSPFQLRKMRSIYERRIGLLGREREVEDSDIDVPF